ncbi:MAG TPA: HAD hydrolase-like protein [Mycobacteriales bacterium]|nr:HAD hydrolase-like protein [Mycobacteriales bacterium]
MDLVVGFDLDMTLVDARPGAREVWQRLAADLGVPIDVELVLSRMGPPLEQELAHWFPADQVEEVAEAYRTHSADFGAVQVEPMLGAREAVAAVRRHGGRVVIATAKKAELGATNLRVLGIEVDALHGWCWGETKGDAMLAEGAQVFVGDHPHDVVGARRAGAVSVGVRTGGTEPVDADVLLDDLTGFPAWLDGWVLEKRLAALDAHLRQLGSVLVAFSGGADSAFLLAAAVRVLGPDRVAAATAVSPSLALDELPAARAFAASLGVRHLTPGTDELSRPGYVANGADRCFHCKATLLDTLRPLALAHGLAHVATGTNADDAVAGFRPGISAAAERGAVTPLLDAGLTKGQVREASRRWGLVTADKPALACLASRIAYGVHVTPTRLARVDRVESALRVLLRPTDVRVRDLGDDKARVELDEAALARWDDEAESLVHEEFARVEARLFRSGSMNDLLRAGAPEQAEQR